MGMSLDTDYILLDEKKYNKLKNKELYIKNIYKLELISKRDAENNDKIIYYNALKEKFENDKTYIISDKFENNSFEDFIKNIADNFIEYSELSITLDEFLNYDYDGGWIVNKLHEEKIGDKKIYLLIQTKYW